MPLNPLPSVRPLPRVSRSQQRAPAAPQGKKAGILPPHTALQGAAAPHRGRPRAAHAARTQSRGALRPWTRLLPSAAAAADKVGGGEREVHEGLPLLLAEGGAGLRPRVQVRLLEVGEGLGHRVADGGGLVRGPRQRQ
eukprot:CAMPEP_0118931474 /NCGR_PEP_ID=MMETSP1169-20130426/7800_1 /TAXON_ID=36882 /ORGANISM="Pyramimonas obovata, Strain CCMP722" /LENGTH=137 /DNA_ID=CAMNT_0006873979 /DNA_START=270 /DNA_END=681 /DNA_ORIENTATION=+